MDYMYPGGSLDIEMSAPAANNKNVVHVISTQGTSSEVFTDVVYPTVMFLCEGTPGPSLATLVVIGLDADETSTLIQRMVFEENGTFVSRDAVETHNGLRILEGTAVEDTSAAYVYDEAGGELLVLEDDDQDGILDNPGAVFATAATFPDLEEIGSLSSPEEGIVHVVSTAQNSVLSLGSTVTVIKDTNGDGSADTETTSLVKDDFVFGPLFGTELHDGDTSLRVRGTVNSEIEVWRVDSEGAPIELLGTGAIDYESNELELALAVPLVEGDLIMIKDLTENRAPDAVEVQEAQP